MQGRGVLRTTHEASRWQASLTLSKRCSDSAVGTRMLPQGYVGCALLALLPRESRA